MITSPVLLLQAQHDDMTSPRNAQFIRDRVGSARRELVMLEQSYHLISVDVERSIVAERMRTFCDSLTCRADAVTAEGLRA